MKWVLRFVLLLVGASLGHCQEIPCTNVGGIPGGMLRDQYDVVVVGAGTGGIAAALQAARMGSTVLLVELTDWIGGQMSAAGVTSMDEGYPPRASVRERGIYGEFWRRATAYYRALGKSTDTCAVSEDHFAVEPHVSQQILYDMIRDTRRAPLDADRSVVLDVLLCARVVGLEREDRTIRGVRLRVAPPDGLSCEKLVMSDIVIDATEYGDVVPLTGAAYRIGIWLNDHADPSAERIPPVQPITWTAVIKQYAQGVPASLQIEQLPPGYRPESIRPFLARDGTGTSKRPWTWERFLKYRGMPDSASPRSAHNGSGFSLTRTHINFVPNDQPMTVVDVEDEVARCDAETQARLRTLGVLYYMRHELQITDWSVANDMGYDSPYNRREVAKLLAQRPELEPFREILYHFPVKPYVRESRRIVGLHTLRAAELRRKAPYRAVHFEQAVAMGDYPVDLHGEHEDRDIQVELDLDEPIDLPERWIQWGYGPFQIPFDCFIPREMDGFLVAEKNLSQSRIANGATRLQPVTMLTGQAAGAIAALACRLDCAPRNVAPLLVQRALLDGGSTLVVLNYDDVVHGTELWKSLQLLKLYQLIDGDEDEFRELKKVTREEFQEIWGRLADRLGEDVKSLHTASNAAEQELLTRGDLARLVASRLVDAAQEFHRLSRLAPRDALRN